MFRKIIAIYVFDNSNKYYFLACKFDYFYKHGMLYFTVAYIKWDINIQNNSMTPPYIDIFEDLNFVMNSIWIFISKHLVKIK